MLSICRPWDPLGQGNGRSFRLLYVAGLDWFLLSLHTHPHTYINRDTHTHSYTHPHPQKHTHPLIHTHTHPQKHTYTLVHSYIHRKTYIHLPTPTTASQVVLLAPLMFVLLGSEIGFHHVLCISTMHSIAWSSRSSCSNFRSAEIPSTSHQDRITNIRRLAAFTVFPHP